MKDDRADESAPPNAPAPSSDPLSGVQCDGRREPAPQVLLLELRDQHGGRGGSRWQQALPEDRGSAKRSRALHVPSGSDRHGHGVHEVFDCSVTPCATYAYLQGTSMASPHVAGVAASIVSQSGKHGGSVEAGIQQTANAMPCPCKRFLAGTPFEASCQPAAGHNSFFGSGEG